MIKNHLLAQDSQLSAAAGRRGGSCCVPSIGRSSFIVGPAGSCGCTRRSWGGGSRSSASGCVPWSIRLGRSSFVVGPVGSCGCSRRSSGCSSRSGLRRNGYGYCCIAQSISSLNYLELGPDADKIDKDGVAEPPPRAPPLSVPLEPIAPCAPKPELLHRLQQLAKYWV
jgi:hypothetical protein